MEKILSILHQRISTTPKLAVQLGSGLAFLADALEHPVRIPYEDLPGFPKPTVEGHGGEFIFGHIEGVPVLFLSGRVHFYEGYTLNEVTTGAQIVAALEIPIFLITNAAGAVNETFKEGDLMVITDHINFSGSNPLMGKKHPNASRFVDQSDVYRKELRQKIKHAAKISGVTVREGVYMWFSGPSYETPAEVRMARVMGADAVGMSTVPEAMVAHSLGVQCAGISMITNMAAGIKDQALDHNEVLETGKRAADTMRQLFFAFVKELKNETH